VVPKRRLGGRLPASSGIVNEISSSHRDAKRVPEQRTEWNVRDSAATVVFVPSSNYRSRGTDFAIACAKKYGKPCYVVHYLDDGANIDIKNVISRFGEEQSLNIAGPRESEHPGAYDRCLAILIEAFGLPLP
jgi:Circularly permutated YpsA SLOG family